MFKETILQQKKRRKSFINEESRGNKTIGLIVNQKEGKIHG
jgi:hypothetical protein